MGFRNLAAAIEDQGLRGVLGGKVGRPAGGFDKVDADDGVVSNLIIDEPGLTHVETGA